MTTPGTCYLQPGTYCGGIETCSSVTNGVCTQGNPSSAVTISFSPGLYVLNGGGMQIGTSFTSSGSGSSASSTSAGSAGDPDPGPAPGPPAPAPAPAPPPGAGSGTAGNCGGWSPSGMDEPVTTNTANVTLSGSGVTFYNTGTSTTYAPINILATSSSSLSAPTSNSGSGSEGIIFFQDRSVGACTENIIDGGTYTGTFYFEPSLLGFAGSSGTYNYFIADMLQITNGMTINANTTSLANGSLVKIGSALAE